MRYPVQRRHILAVILFLSLLIFAGCDTTTVIVSGGGSPTASSSSGGGAHAPTATPTPAPHALAWFQMDSHNVGQIWASVNGGSPHQITHMPAASGDCLYDEHWGPPVFSPDLSKVVAGWGSADCTDGPENGPLYVVDASSGVATKIPSSGVRLSLRQAGWIDNSTVWWIDGKRLHAYTVGGSDSVVGTLSANFAQDAVLRGNTLFFTDGSSTLTSYTLKRFDMSSHSVLPGSISLGTINPCLCSRGDALTPGFDVSPDGSHIVYQTVTPASGANRDPEGVGSSRFYYASADGSGASRIATVGTAASMVKMQISPNGQLVAVARAEPAPSVFTVSVTSAGASGDPSMHFYSPDAHSYPVWKTDSATFWASTKEVAEVSPPTSGNVEHFDVGVASGSVGVANGSNPWYTIGS